jgi:phage terminase large subunit-like protein
VIVETLGEDIAQVASLCSRIDESGKLAHVGLDMAGIGLIVDALADNYITGDRIVGISQGWKLTNAIKTAERKLAEGSFIHCGQPLMAWAVGNAKVEPRGNAIVITKQASGTAKIDPLMAMFDCVALMSTNPSAAGSIYDDAEAYQDAFGARRQSAQNAAAAGGTEWSARILADPNHPEFAEHKRRFELWQSKQPDEDRNEPGWRN